MAQEGLKTPVQLEFSEEAFYRLGELKSITGSQTEADVIQKSLHTLDWILAKKM